jgi:aspartokinase
LQRASLALAGEEINIISIAQGSSEYNLSMAVDHEDVNRGVQAIHQQFDLDKVAVPVAGAEGDYPCSGYQ